MRTPRRSPVCRGLALLGLCSWLVGCHKWVAMDEPYADSITAEQPEQIRIQLDAGDVTAEVSSVRIEEDAVVGEAKDGTELRYPLDRIASVEERKTDVKAIVGWTVLGVAIGFFIGAAVWASSNCCV